jgi:hypothetical protein
VAAGRSNALFATAFSIHDPERSVAIERRMTTGAVEREPGDGPGAETLGPRVLPGQILHHYGV